MRGADGGPWGRICALPALWVGLLYDAGALDAAWDVVKHWTMDEREGLRNAVPKLALGGPNAGGGSWRDIAGEVVDTEAAGLATSGGAKSDRQGGGGGNGG